MRKLRRFPFTWILLGAWIVLKVIGINIQASSITGIIFVIAGFVVMIIEFYKSADIGLTTFKIEQASSLVASVVWGFCLAKFVHSWGDLHIGDFIVGVVVLMDGWLAPSASFAMALRNLAGNIGHDHNAEGG